jgi:hypothetical protein
VVPHRIGSLRMQPRISATQPRISATQPRISATQPRISATQPRISATSHGYSKVQQRKKRPFIFFPCAQVSGSTAKRCAFSNPAGGASRPNRARQLGLGNAGARSASESAAKHTARTIFWPRGARHRVDSHHLYRSARWCFADRQRGYVFTPTYGSSLGITPNQPPQDTAKPRPPQEV